MNNKLMTRKEFARRLEKMLTKYAGTECGHCPGAPWFKKDRKTWAGACSYCMEISDKPEVYYIGKLLVPLSWQCPCLAKGPEGAVKAGWAWLEKEKAGE